ncbi:sm-like ribonucleo protein [Gigaspora margarita]|uniref:Sm-like ribonucleo protein n=1 Tax=Gigaspora margarita TaxID=4874 RepID=A0A8H4A7L5_GIGMA|nr:sm-like ribonucleo protein [Gigaspora margarita]
MNDQTNDNTLETKEVDDYDKYNCSLASELDYFVMCYSLGGQAINYYRYGERRDCSQRWQSLKFCIQLKSKTPEERKKMILEREAMKDAKYTKQKSSLDVWEMREKPPAKLFPLHDQIPSDLNDQITAEQL